MIGRARSRRRLLLAVAAVACAALSCVSSHTDHRVPSYWSLVTRYQVGHESVDAYVVGVIENEATHERGHVVMLNSKWRDLVGQVMPEVAGDHVCYVRTMVAERDRPVRVASARYEELVRAHGAELPDEMRIAKIRGRAHVIRTYLRLDGYGWGWDHDRFDGDPELARQVARLLLDVGVTVSHDREIGYEFDTRGWDTDPVRSGPWRERERLARLIAKRDAVTRPDLPLLEWYLMAEGSLLPKSLIVRTLAELGHDARGAVPALVRAIRQPARYVDDREALDALVKTTDDPVTWLLRGLESDNVFVPEGSAWALGELRREPERALPALRHALESATKDYESELRLECARAIWMFSRDAATAVPVAVRELASPVDELDADPGWESDPGMAARILGEIGPDAASAAGDLVKALKHGTADVPVRAAVALGRIGVARPDVITALRAATKSKRADVARAAADALAKLDSVGP